MPEALTLENAPIRERIDFAEIAAEIDGLYMEARNWADGQPIDSEEMHEVITALQGKLGDAARRAEELRKKIKAPYDAKVDEIQEAFGDLLADTKGKTGKVTRGKSALAALLLPWREKKRREAEAAAEETRRRARDAEARATEAIRASAGNIEEREDAETQLKEAKAMGKIARKATVAAATRTGMRRAWRAELTDIRAACRHYFAQPARAAAFAELVTAFANAEVRAGKRDTPGQPPAIPGFVIKEEQTAI